MGQPYQQIIRAAGGEPPYEFTITGLQGTGLAPNSNSETTALISGIPESRRLLRDDGGREGPDPAAGHAALQVRGQRPGHPGPDRPRASARDPGKAYPETQLVSGSTAVKWEIYSGEMPAGVVLSDDGMLSGTVEANARPRTYTFLVRAYDAKGGEGYGSFSILLQAKKLAAGLQDHEDRLRQQRRGRIAVGLAAPALLGAALRAAPSPPQRSPCRR